LQSIKYQLEAVGKSEALDPVIGSRIHSRRLYRNRRVREPDKTSLVYDGDTERFPRLWKQAEYKIG
jgi:hypothetical protein